jgi:hypothetical protein
VEKAYDKTTAIVQSVKGLLVTGLSKIKSYIGGGGDTGREKSRTSRSAKKGRGRQMESDEDSFERYKTPVGGRSKSRSVFSKVVPIDAMRTDEEEEQYQEEERKRHVNFNINRVVTMQPDEG